MLIQVVLILFGTAFAAPPFVNVPGLGSLKGVYVANGKPSIVRRDVSAFLGIPYAKPPVDDLRWRPPQAHGPWAGSRDATHFGNICMQVVPSYLQHNRTLSEDCLFLNVFSPTVAVNSSKKLPVMLWVHGGAYMDGESDDYPGDGLVIASKLQVVVVTINYRLNVFGFLGSKDLEPRDPAGSTGNYGIQDQRLAMTWARDHIAAFGGDGANILIFGESAGGSSMLNHLTQPLSFSLYNKVIVESGTYQGTVELAAAETTYATFLKTAKCQDLPCLLKLSAADLEKAAPGALTPGALGPVVDGVELTDEPINLIQKGRFNNKVPVMLGSNRDEVALFALLPPIDKLFPPQMTAIELDYLLASKVGSENVATVRKLYDPAVYKYPDKLGKFNQNWWTAVRADTDEVPGLGTCGVRSVARALVAGGSPAVFAYLFAHPTQGAKGAPPLPGTGPGSVTVGHASEIDYAFGDIAELQPGQEANVGREMSRYWSNFGMTGNPNNGNPNAEMKWTSFTAANNDTMQLLQTVSEGGIAPIQNERKAACDFWDQRAKSVATRDRRGFNSPNDVIVV